jgi:aspartyl/asparaginyl beta-hydroxylase (cupin superfamily)
MQNAQASLQQVGALETEAVRAAQSGRDDVAVSLWNRILEIDPGHGRTLTALGQRAFRNADFQFARAAFQRLVDADGSDPEQWINLALACRQLKDEPAEDVAIQRALVLEPKHLVALILRANLLERQGKTHQAALACAAIAQASPPLEHLRAELRPAVSQALRYREQYGREFGAFLDQYLEPLYRTFAGDNLKRFRDSLDIMVGRKRRYESRSELYHYPGLAPIEFFDRTDFPWLDPIEAAADDIRDEFLAILQAEEGFTPYVSYPPGVPLNQWAELNNSPSWSAFHLYKMGKLVEENATRCPRTMEALKGAPQPDQIGRTPAVMFSLLKPRTRIPPHTGVTNVRLVTHLPLIIPEGCGFRVGNDTRQWVPGKAWVFDDTIEHEAWNDSDKPRVVLIFDIWHPHLTPPERALITALTAGANAFTGGSGSPEPGQG